MAFLESTPSAQASAAPPPASAGTIYINARSSVSGMCRLYSVGLDGSGAALLGTIPSGIARTFAYDAEESRLFVEHIHNLEYCTLGDNGYAVLIAYSVIPGYSQIGHIYGRSLYFGEYQKLHTVNLDTLGNSYLTTPEARNYLDPDLGWLIYGGSASGIYRIRYDPTAAGIAGTLVYSAASSETGANRTPRLVATDPVTGRIFYYAISVGFCSVLVDGSGYMLHTTNDVRSGRVVDGVVYFCDYTEGSVKSMNVDGSAVATLWTATDGYNAQAISL